MVLDVTYRQWSVSELKDEIERLKDARIKVHRAAANIGEELDTKLRYASKTIREAIEALEAEVESRK